MGIDAALSRNWWAVLIRGLVTLAFGVVAFAMPRMTVGILVILFAIYVLEDGIMTIVGASRARRRGQDRGAMPIEGVVSIAFGIMALLTPMRTVTLAAYVVAIWALCTGVLELMTGAGLRRQVEGEWIMVASGLVRIACGVLMLVWPHPAVQVVVWIVGGYAFGEGIALIGLSIELKRYGGRPRADTRGLTPQPA